MNLNSVFQLMAAASLGKGRRLRVTDRISCAEIRQLEKDGLVEISPRASDAGPGVAIERLTARGRRVLRAFAAPLRKVPALRNCGLPLPPEATKPAHEPGAKTAAKMRGAGAFPSIPLPL